jgi:hypothetical protein
MTKASRAETIDGSASRVPRTVLGRIPALGPELDEGQLLSVTGGKPKDGGSDPTTSCPSGCHD